VTYRSRPSRGLHRLHRAAQPSRISPRLNNTWNPRSQNPHEAKTTPPVIRPRRMQGPQENLFRRLTGIPKLKRVPAHWSSTKYRERSALARRPETARLERCPPRNRPVRTRNASPVGARTWGSSSRRYIPRCYNILVSSDPQRRGMYKCVVPLGKTAARGDLFDHMNESRPPQSHYTDAPWISYGLSIGSDPVALLAQGWLSEFQSGRRRYWPPRSFGSGYAGCDPEPSLHPPIGVAIRTFECSNGTPVEIRHGRPSLGDGCLTAAGLRAPVPVCDARSILRKRRHDARRDRPQVGAVSGRLGITPVQWRYRRHPVTQADPRVSDYRVPEIPVSRAITSKASQLAGQNQARC
jgi:hypothetical protein